METVDKKLSKDNHMPIKARWVQIGWTVIPQYAPNCVQKLWLNH